MITNLALYRDHLHNSDMKCIFEKCGPREAYKGKTIKVPKWIPRALYTRHVDDEKIVPKFTEKVLF